MSEKIRQVPAKKVIKVLESLGFVQVRQKGSHVFMQHPDGRITVIPVHSGKDLGKGLVWKLLQDVKLSRDEWLELLKSLIIF
ncbi:MAG: type II toxin-antitoxin system HicA family toxin [Methanolobus sp.]|nr:type II toxin-antitoxin system HicA family toxin [Methanolobus sp.]